MADVLSYILSLQENLSSKMKKIGISSSEALDVFSSLERQTNEVNRRMQTMGRSVTTLKDKLSLLQNERDLIPARNIEAIRRYNKEIERLNGEINRLQTTTAGGLKKGFINAFNQIPYSNLITNPIVLTGTTAFASIKKGMESEKVQVAFEVLLGNKNSAQELIQQTKDYANKTSYDASDLQEGAKTMLSFGIAQEKIMPTMKAIGDIAMGDKNKMSSLTLAFSQMSSTGKLTGQDLLQMINAGFNPLNEISKKTGKSIGVLKDEMGKGAISSQMVADAFMSATAKGGQFFGMADKQGQTLAGKLAMIQGQLSEVLLSVYELIEPILTPAVAGLSKALNVLKGIVTGVTKFFQSWWQKMREGIGVISIVSVVLGGLVAGLIVYNTWIGIVSVATKLWAGVQALLNAVMTANPIGLIIMGIGALIAVIVYVCSKITGWATLWGGAIGFMKNTFLAYVDSIKFAWNGLVNGIMIGINKIKEGWYSFKEALGIGDSEENQKALAKIKADTEARKKAIADGAKKVANDKQKALESVKQIDLKWDNSKKFSDVQAEVQNKLGVNGQLQSNVNATTGKTGNEQSKTENAIVTGGQRNTNVNISIKSLVENLVLNESMKEKAEEIEEQFSELMMRVLNMAQSTVS
ncbi:MAG: tape measure protein [Bacteroidales bacterium]|nr:tape measure protein [Bacteroidales bacterium]